MTISSTTRKAGPFSGTGTQAAFPFSFKVFEASDVLVVQTDAQGNETPLSLGSQYTVALSSDQDGQPGGVVTLRVAVPVGQLLTISSSVPLTQGVSIPNMGGFYPRVIERALDKLTIAAQQVADTVSRGLRFPLSDPAPNGALPTAGSRSGKFLGFDAAGNPVALTGTGADAALRTDLANLVGATLVGYANGGTALTVAQMLDLLYYGVANVMNPRFAGGAKGDGAHDDQPAIQAAIDSLTNGGIVYLPQPSVRYRLGGPLNLYKPGLDNSKTIKLQGESNLNTQLWLDNNAAAAAINYDDGSKRIDVSGCSIAAGSSTLTTTGNFVTAGVEVGNFAVFDGLSSFATVTAVSAGSVTVNEAAAGAGGVTTAIFYKFANGGNRVEIRDLYIKNSFAYSAYSAWHPGTGINLNGAFDSALENVRVEGFTKGVYWFGGYISKASNLYVTKCLWGMWLECANYASIYERITSVNNGATGNGAGIYIVNNGGLTFNDLILEDSNKGLIAENVRGLTISGGNIETVRDYAIVLRGLSYSGKQYQNLWTTGVTITGLRWYVTLGLFLSPGVKGVKFYSHNFEAAPDYNPGTSRPCINYADGNENTIQDIDYGECQWYPAYPVTLHINYRNTNLPSAQTFTQNGMRYCDAEPYYGKFWKKGMTLQNISPDAGSFGAFVCTADANGTADGTAIWGTNGQNGYRTNAGSPVGAVTPKFIGERLLDTTNKKWYFAAGATAADWS